MRGFVQFVQHPLVAGDVGEGVTIPGAGHFDLVIPTTPAWKTVVGLIAREMQALP